MFILQKEILLFPKSLSTIQNSPRKFVSKLGNPRITLLVVCTLAGDVRGKRESPYRPLKGQGSISTNRTTENSAYTISHHSAICLPPPYDLGRLAGKNEVETTKEHLESLDKNGYNCDSSLLWRHTKLDRNAQIAVIGAGVSGLAACKALLEAGFRVQVFETRDSIGGIWARTYKSTSLQTPKTAYRFSDFDWPEEAPMNPSHTEVVEYLEGYVEKFSLKDHLVFNSRVVEVRRCNEKSKLGWDVLIQRKVEGKNGGFGVEEKWQYFDFVVNCCGCFGEVPNIPKFPPGEGPETFSGTVMHSSEYSGLSADESRDLLSGKRVVVVGYQKTAIDVAIEAAEANKGPNGKPCTLLFRKAHWMVPRDQLIGGIHLKFLLSTRIAELFQRRPNQSFRLTVLQTLLPLRWIVGKLVEIFLCSKYPLKRYGLIPSQSFMEDLAGCILPQMPPDFFPLVESRRIQLAKSQRWKFSTTGVEASDGRHVAADVVLLCTGYDGLTKLKSMLPKEFGDKLSEKGENIYLYRGVIHPQVPSMAFLGFHEGASSVQTSEMGAKWLSKLLQGSFHLPSVGDMDRDRLSWWEYKKTQTPFSGRVSCVIPIHAWHFDRLCRDMGWQPMRKKGVIANWFETHSSADYMEREEDKQQVLETTEKYGDSTEIAMLTPKATIA